MKKILFSLLLLAGVVFAASAQELLTFGGYHTQLYGYTDNRYVGEDQGDYLKTLAWYSGAEFFQKGFETDSPDTKNLVLGGAVVFYSQNGFDSKTLYAVKKKSADGKTTLINIPEKTVPKDLDDRVARFQVTGSAFGGYSDQWWGAEGGLSIFIKGFEEKSRQMYKRNGDIIEVAGRGWVFGDGSVMLPNLRLRFGSEVLPHFVLSLHRGNYDPGYGAFQGRVILPFSSDFKLQVGGSLFQTSSVFIEPTLGLGDLSASLRAGTILNYNDSAFTRVGIFEGAFLSGSIGYHW